MAITLAQMRTEVIQNLETEQLAKMPNGDQVIRALNRAKNDVVARLEQIRPNLFVARSDTTVTAGDTSVSLPTGCRRILGVAQVGTDGSESKVRVYDHRDEGEKDTYDCAYWLLLEGNALYYSDSGGWGEGTTIRIRYATSVADLSATDTGASYSLVPDEWTDLITIQATLDLLPAGHLARAKWTDRKVDRLNTLVTSADMFIDDKPLVVRRVDNWEEGSWYDSQT
jgi:hypothetical protein